MRKRRKLIISFTILFNIIVICILLIVLLNNSNGRKKEIFDNQKNELVLSSENISQLLQSYFIQQYHGILDRKEYIENSQNLTLFETMEFLRKTNSDDHLLFQLMETDLLYIDNNGEYTKEFNGSYTRVGLKYYSTYTDENNERKIREDYYPHELVMNLGVDLISDEIDDNFINATAQFTIPFKYYVDNTNEYRNHEQGMAIYTLVTLPSNNENYFLMSVFAMKDIISMGIPIVNYKDADCLLINSDGQYISYTSNLMSGNNDSFWTYLREVYGLEDSKPTEIRQIIESNENGNISIQTGRNTKKCDAILVFNTLNNTNQWKYISIVPEYSLMNDETDWSYVTIILLFVSFLIIFDGAIIMAFSHELKQSLREIEKEAERAYKATQSKSSFLSRMSHEIRTPLNAIIGYNLIALNELDDIHNESDWKNKEVKFTNCLSKSEIASKHLLTLINDVLDMSAIESGKIKISHERFDFKELISSLTTIFYTTARKKDVSFEVIFENQVDEWLVGDQIRLNQILMNLLSNAIKFTLNGGIVTLLIKKIKEENDTATIQFTVKDSGIGMSKEYLERIWTPFEQADSSISRRFGGSGLGLAITKNLIELMNGEISVKSEPDIGSIFTINLSFGHTDDLTKNSVYDFNHLKVLVVDDDENTCEYTHMLCMRYGVKCDTVTSGFAAIKAIEKAIEQNDKYTALLIDWKMPSMNGIETARRIKDLTTDNIPIIILSAYDYTEIADEASKVGIDRFISKPLFQSTLFDLLASIAGYNIDSIKKEKVQNDFSGNRVLLVEDNPMNMEIAESILQSAHLIVDKAKDGFEALNSFLDSKEGTYMCILMDIHMPGLNGLETTRKIRSSNHPEAKTIPIIAMTADAFSENVTEALDAGMNDHISKPIQVDILFNTLNRYKK